MRISLVVQLRKGLSVEGVDKVLKDVVQTFLGSEIKKTEETETDPYGVHWEVLKDSTSKEKQRLGYSLKILTRTGDMWKNDIHINQVGDGVQVKLTGPAALHQTGTRYLPKRAILPDGRGVPDSWEKKLGLEIEQRLQSLFRK